MGEALNKDVGRFVLSVKPVNDEAGNDAALDEVVRIATGKHPITKNVGGLRIGTDGGKRLLIYAHGKEVRDDVGQALRGIGMDVRHGR
jgi:hypothetical protein